ncbi:MAG: YbaK/EbsC family protein [Azospirillum sp.]|nr:YbaK/EbsC family protein [Azospirillum sp.]
MAERPLSPSAQRVQDVLESLGCRGRVVELADSTRTAAEAAAAVGCSVGEIAKSLIFKTKDSGRPVLVIASGSNRVNEKALGRRLETALGGERLVRADPDFVRRVTGFAIGGVPPVGHAESPVVAIDSDLFDYQRIWAAAGTPFAVFPLTPDELQRITGGTVETVT